jgi:ATP-dependent protease ClpP protease subunit
VRLLRSLVASLLVAGCATPRAAYCSVPKAAARRAPVELFIGPVDGDTSGEFIVALRAAVKRGEPFVNVTIDSPGGDVFEGLAIIEEMRAAARAGTRTVCVVDGLAASMGHVILQACDVRLMKRTAVLMAHEVAVSGVGGKPDALRRLAQRLDDIGHWLAIMESARMNITVEEFEARIKDREWFFGAAEAVAVGAVDGVV